MDKIDFKVRYSAGPCEKVITKELKKWQEENKVERLWKHDATLWTNTDESQWMGWLDVAAEDKEVQRIKTLANTLRREKFTDIALLGMGGSSLCPDMIANTFGAQKDLLGLHILDSTDPIQIKQFETCFNIKTTLFIVSSKSGSTLEPNIFKDYFFKKVQKALHKEEVGDRFIAITDPGSSLEKIAQQQHFRAIFHGIPSIGGRYSALSNFGMAPAGMMGLDIQTFLSHAKAMRQACSVKTPVHENPGVVLGVILGTCAAQFGKNKVTLVVSPAVSSLGAWLEQLIAESTGKEGKGLIPIDQEPLSHPNYYSKDRVFVYTRYDKEPDPKQEALMDALEKTGHVVVRLHLSDKMHLGAELFRWEIATDVAGSIIGIDPFNQPNVEESKVLARKLTSEYEKTGHLSQIKPFYNEHGISLFADESNLEDIKKHLRGEPNLANYLKAHLNRVQENDYVNFSAFIERSETHTDLLQVCRAAIRDQKKVATCLGFGPRFLHSTGQDYVGGPNTGVFIQLTSDYKEDLVIPNKKYTFGLVITAQALSYFTVLGKRGRRVLRVHLGRNPEKALNELRDLLTH